MSSYWIQIDVNILDRPTRFFMNDWGGEDWVAGQVYREGWRSYQAPLPIIIAKFCYSQSAVFIESGADTDYFSLLAASVGARHVFNLLASEGLEHKLLQNMHESALDKKITLVPLVSESWANLDTMFLDHPVLSTLGSAVLKLEGSKSVDIIECASQFIHKFKPLMLLNFGSDDYVQYLSDFESKHDYLGFDITANGQLVPHGSAGELVHETGWHLLVAQNQFQTLKQIIA